VLIAGAGDYSFDWSLVQPALARETRVCSYDRAGFAWSDVGPNPRTMLQEAVELHLLLQNGGVRSPVLLVGHSIGGLIARVYAREYPNEVAGLALVDATSEDTQLSYRGNIVRVRESAQPRPVPAPTVGPSATLPRATAREMSEFAGLQRMLGHPAIEPPYDRLPPAIQRIRLWADSDTIKRAAIQEDFWPEELQQIHDDRVKNPQTLGDLPLLIVAAAREEPLPPDLKPDQLAQFQQLRTEKRRQREESAQLSSNSLFFSDPRSGHAIHLEDPEWLTRSLLTELGAVRQRLETKSEIRTLKRPAPSK
jgi:pimeloyl-ACP methyl ester carboxylesterase